MKFLITSIFILYSNVIFSRELSHSEISNLYLAGKLEEREFIKANLNKIQKETLLKKMQQSAILVSNVWPDTILEGGYDQLEDAKLDTSSIQGLYYKNTLVGFSAYARASAVYIEECSSDDDVTYNECLQDYKGSIFQLFLMNSKGEYIEEYNEPADFDS